MQDHAPSPATDQALKPTSMFSRTPGNHFSPLALDPPWLAMKPSLKLSRDRTGAPDLRMICTGALGFRVKGAISVFFLQKQCLTIFNIQY